MYTPGTNHKLEWINSRKPRRVSINAIRRGFRWSVHFPIKLSNNERELWCAGQNSQHKPLVRYSLTRWRKLQTVSPRSVNISEVEVSGVCTTTLIRLIIDLHMQLFVRIWLMFFQVIARKHISEDQWQVFVQNLAWFTCFFYSPISSPGGHS